MFLRDAMLGAYLLALVYGTLYPWSGWRSIGLPGFGFLFDPWPRYWTGFDLAVNVAIYLVPGALLARRLPLGRTAGVLAATACCCALSLLLESLQGFLPGRVPSRLDWLANTGGALSGALSGALLGRVRVRLPAWSLSRWDRHSLPGADRAVGVALLFAWILMQVFPHRPLFGHGNVAETALRLIGAALERGPATGTPARVEANTAGLAAGLRAGIEQGVPLEAFTTAAAVVAVGLIVREIWPARAPRVFITLAVFSAALAARSLGAALQAGPSQAFGWISAGAQGGLVTGAAALSMLASGRRRARLGIAIGAIAAAAALTNVYPHDAYGVAALPDQERSALRNFNGLLEALAAIWPLAAILWCARRIRALRHSIHASQDPTR